MDRFRETTLEVPFHPILDRAIGVRGGATGRIDDMIGCAAITVDGRATRS